MKKKIFKRYRTKKREGQRYWIVEKPRNFGSQIIRQRIRKDLPLLSKEEFETKKDIIEAFPSTIGEILPQTHRRKELVRIFEKNPELYKELRTKKPSIFFYTGKISKAYPDINTITLSDPESKGWIVYNKKDGQYRTQGLEPHLRHEFRHLSDFEPIANIEKWKSLPKSLKESSATSAEYLSIRRQKVPKRIIESNIQQFLSDKNGL